MDRDVWPKFSQPCQPLGLASSGEKVSFESHVYANLLNAQAPWARLADRPTGSKAC